MACLVDATIIMAMTTISNRTTMIGRLWVCGHVLACGDMANGPRVDAPVLVLYSNRCVDPTCWNDLMPKMVALR